MAQYQHLPFGTPCAHNRQQVLARMQPSRYQQLTGLRHHYRTGDAQCDKAMADEEDYFYWRRCCQLYLLAEVMEHPYYSAENDFRAVMRKRIESR